MIILDTNALIYSVKKRIDIQRFSSDEIGVPSSVITELENLSSEIKEAKLALKLIPRFKVLKVELSGDRGIIEAATKYGGIVLTNDRELRKNLRGRDIRVASVSGSVVRKI